MLIDDIPSSVTYEYTGVRTFSINFPFYGAESIRMGFRESGAPTLAPYTELVKDVDFTVTGTRAGVGDSEIAFISGKAVLTDAGVLKLSTGNVIVVYRDTPATQLYAYNEYDNFPAKSHENALGRGIVIAQEQREALGRTLTLPPGSGSGADVVSTILDAVDNATDAASRSASEADRSASEADRAEAEADRSKAEADRSASEADRSEVAAAAAGRDVPLKICWIAGRGLPGHITLSDDNGLQLRSAYPQLWPFIEEHMDVRTEAQWQAARTNSQAGGTSGTVGFFSAGDGSTTFRFPLVRNVYVLSTDAPAGVLSGTQQQMTRYWTNGSATGYVPSVVLTPVMKVIDVIMDPSLLLADEFVRSLNTKLDTARYEADFAAGAPFAPSLRVVNLPLVSGSNHIAPGDGYFTGYVVAGAQQQGLWAQTSAGLYTASYSTMANAHLSFTLPVAKGQNMSLSYSTTGAGGYFTFVYANRANRG